MSRHVGIPLVIPGYLADTTPDMYSYNFPDDRRFLKVLGEYSRLIYVSCQLIGNFTSLLPLLFRYRPNGSDGGRYLPLVYSRVRRCGPPEERQFLPNR